MLSLIAKMVHGNVQFYGTLGHWTHWYMGICVVVFNHKVMSDENGWLTSTGERNRCNN